MKDLIKVRYSKRHLTVRHHSTRDDVVDIKEFVQERTESDGQVGFGPLKQVSWDDYPCIVLNEIEHQGTSLHQCPNPQFVTEYVDHSVLVIVPPVTQWYELFFSLV